MLAILSGTQHNNKDLIRVDSQLLLFAILQAAQTNLAKADYVYTLCGSFLLRLNLYTNKFFGIKELLYCYIQPIAYLNYRKYPRIFC